MLLEHGNIPLNYRTTPAVIFRCLIGMCEQHDASAWTQWAEGVIEELWQEREHMANLFVSLALWWDALMMMSCSPH